MDEASCILQDRSNILKVTTTYLRSKVMPEGQDAVVEAPAPQRVRGAHQPDGRIPDGHASGAGEAQRRLR